MQLILKRWENCEELHLSCNGNTHSRNFQPLRVLYVAICNTALWSGWAEAHNIGFSVQRIGCCFLIGIIFVHINFWWMLQFFWKYFENLHKGKNKNTLHYYFSLLFWFFTFLEVKKENFHEQQNKYPQNLLSESDDHKKHKQLWFWQDCNLITQKNTKIQNVSHLTHQALGVFHSSARNIKNSSLYVIIWAGWVNTNTILIYNENTNMIPLLCSRLNIEAKANKDIPQLEGVDWVGWVLKRVQVRQWSLPVRLPNLLNAGYQTPASLQRNKPLF